MAKQVQYRGAARARGFSPQQVSDAAISRMREDSNRTLQGMREAARADIEQRQRISAEVKANQQYEKGAREKNFQIQTQNQQTELRQIQLDSQVALQQLETDQAAQTKIFENVANLSQTAAEKYEEIQKVKSDERAQQAINEFLINPNQDEVIRQVLGEYELAATEEVRQSELDVVQAKGGPRLAISKARSLDSNGRYKLDQARANYILTNIYPQQLNKALLDAGDLDSGQTAALVTTFKRDFIQKSGILNLKPEMIRDGLAAVNEVNQGIQTKAQNREIKINEGIAVDNATTILTQNPSAFNQNIVSSFNTIVRNNGGDYQKAYEWLEGLATQRGVNGKYLFTLDQIANATVNKGQPFAVSNPGRMGAIKMARERGDTQYRSAQIQADDLRYKEDEKKFLQALTQDNSKEFAEETLLFFMESHGKIPQSIQKFANSYTYDAVLKAKRIEELEALPDGFITNEAVDALSGMDPTAGRALAERKAAQDRKYTTGAFKSQSDALKTAANGVTSIGSQKANTNSSDFLLIMARADYRQRVDRAVAGGMDFNTAATTIGQELAKEITAGARDEKSKWYRKPSTAGGAADFPNLNVGNLPALEKANRRYAALKKDIYDKGLSTVLQTPESIITKEEAVAIMNGYGKPGFTIPLDVVAVAGMSNGADPFIIINAQLEALDLDPLEPPQIIKDVRSQMTPSSRALLFDARAREQARIRAVQQGVSQTSGDTSVFRQPMRMRAGSTFRRTSSNNTIENILSSLTDADWDELGYVVSSEAARNTDDEFGVAASVLTRLASGKYGNSIGEIIRAPGQYEAVYKGMARYEPALSSKLKSAEGREKIRNFFMQLDGRTDFKGQTMLKNRVSSEDPMFAPTGNFYHYAGQ
tara:strand:+ start:734 stop:3364 length:2631 start_codon:yes stop_codon:yes gene_type:complete